MTWIAFGLVFLTMVVYAVTEVAVTRNVKGVLTTQYEAERQDKENHNFRWGHENRQIRLL